ncbi:MAG: helix-turn-helix transcriptional regulator [Bacteroidetes bacterium]|nr:helix-turn-helix transcriptional regulator [Bacteroidota bacterium]
MKLYIKNMVSTRCKMVVESELEKLGLQYSMVDLGGAEIDDEVSPEGLNQLNNALKKWGLELINDNKNVLIEKIKNLIVEMVHYNDELPKTNFSDYLNEKLNRNYTYLANLFSAAQGTTIENFIINHKIERAKELMVYDGLSLTEISYKLNYSSVAHLSSQFKKVTGLTPSNFKQVKEKKLLALENV